MFRDCPTSRMQQGCDSFHFELHCHKPGNWLKYQSLKRASSDTPTGSPRSDGRGRGQDAFTPAWIHNKVSTHMVLVLILLVMMVTDTPVLLENLVTSLLLLSNVAISGNQTVAVCIL